MKNLKNDRAAETVGMDKPVFFRFGFRANILYCPQNSYRMGCTVDRDEASSHLPEPVARSTQNFCVINHLT